LFLFGQITILVLFWIRFLKKRIFFLNKIRIFRRLSPNTMTYQQQILIADDKPANLFTLKSVLAELNVKIIEANNGNEALIATIDNDFALAILDVQMPDLDGYEVAELLRSEDKTKYLPIIFLSAIYSDDFHVFKGYQSGAVDFLTKPFKPEILLSKVRIFLELDRQKQEVRNANKELEAVNEQLQFLNVQLQAQTEEISKKNKNITASLNYAKRIQDAILPPLARINESLVDFFVFFKPRELVSGDFYWFSQKGTKIFVAAVDCTGHGVPGAFMSLIGNDLLHDIVDLMEILEPDHILAELDRQINIALNQNRNENKDGMDMALCVVDFEKKIVDFAGAKNSLCYVQNKELFEIRGDKFPIGGIFSQKNIKKTFTTRNVPLLNEPTTFYIFTDGFQDQFNGKTGKKYTKTQFKHLLLDIAPKQMKEQEQILRKTFEEWKNTEQQIDDVLVIGFRI